ncbi:MAG: diacylglycerol kinase family protein [Candidatus Omnitrophica bacterium]|nr:diacylglycerol kinase family protein [Candidatus Omnitrophota bacterium]
MKKILNGFPHDHDIVKHAEEIIRTEGRKRVIRAHTIFDSFRHAGEGFMYAIRTQRNVRIHLVAFAGVLISGLILRIRALDMTIVLAVSFAVIFAEMINTAFELVLDMVNGTRYHPTVKIIKDLSAAGVLLTALGAAIIGIIVFSKYVF